MTDQHKIRIIVDAAQLCLSISCSILPHSWTRPRGTQTPPPGAGPPPDPEKALLLFPAENHSLRFGGADFYPGRFTLGCKPIQREPQVTGRRSQQDHIICKEQRTDPNRTPSTPCLRLDILSIKVINRIGDKGQPWWIPTLTGNESWFTAGNAEQVLTSVIQGTDSPHKGAWNPIIPEKPL